MLYGDAYLDGAYSSPSQSGLPAAVAAMQQFLRFSSQALAATLTYSATAASGLGVAVPGNIGGLWSDVTPWDDGTLWADPSGLWSDAVTWDDGSLWFDLTLEAVGPQWIFTARYPQLIIANQLLSAQSAQRSPLNVQALNAITFWAASIATSAVFPATQEANALLQFLAAVAQVHQPATQFALIPTPGITNVFVASRSPPVAQALSGALTFIANAASTAKADVAAALAVLGYSGTIGQRAVPTLQQGFVYPGISTTTISQRALAATQQALVTLEFAGTIVAAHRASYANAVATLAHLGTAASSGQPALQSALASWAYAATVATRTLPTTTTLLGDVILDVTGVVAQILPVTHTIIEGGLPQFTQYERVVAKVEIGPSITATIRVRTP